MKNKFMQRAIELSIESINSGGGPFGSVIVKDEKIISEGMNRVTVDNDPTSHGEIVAIRNACKKLNTFNLSNCSLQHNGNGHTFSIKDSNVECSTSELRNQN